jgi:hypothetical protein
MFNEVGHKLLFTDENMFVYVFRPSPIWLNHMISRKIPLGYEVKMN